VAAVLLRASVCAGALAARKRAATAEAEILAHPQYPASGDGRLDQAWADHLAAHKDEFIASGNAHLVDKALADRAIDRIDTDRFNELADLSESPTVSALFMNRMR
jgi:hypothetical protein